MISVPQPATAVAPPAVTSEPARRLSVRDWTALAIAVGGALWISLIFTAIGPILSTMSTALGGGSGGEWIAQLTMTMPDIGMILGGPLAGLIFERYGARPLLLASLGFYAAAGSAGMILENPFALLSTRLLIGLSGVGIATSTTALIGAWLDGQSRAKALSLWNAFGSMGGIASGLAAGAIARIGGTWHAPFALYALATIPFVLSLWATTGSGRPRTVDLPQGTQEKEHTPSVWNLWPIYAAIIPVYSAVFMTAVQLSFLLGSDHIDDPLTQSWVLSAASIGSVFGSIGFMQLKPMLGDRGGMLLFMGLMATGIFLMPLAMNPVIVAIGAALNGAGGGVASPYFTAMLIERAPIAARGRAVGLLFTMQYVGSFANPFVVTPLVHLIGRHNAFFAVSALLAAGMAAAAFRNRRNN